MRDINWIECGLTWQVVLPPKPSNSPQQEEIWTFLKEKYGTNSEIERTKIPKDLWDRYYYSRYRHPEDILKHPDFKLINDYFIFVQEECKRIETMPAMIEYRKSENEWKEVVAGLTSFCDQGLNVPGTLLQLEEKERAGIRFAVVGHVNESGCGCLHDCDRLFMSDIPDDAVVVRYARLPETELVSGLLCT